MPSGAFVIAFLFTREDGKYVNRTMGGNGIKFYRFDTILQSSPKVTEKFLHFPTLLFRMRKKGYEIYRIGIRCRIFEMGSSFHFSGKNLLVDAKAFLFCSHGLWVVHMLFAYLIKIGR